MNRTPVRSSNIASAGYENGTLEIAFVDGGVYQYFNVPEYVYQGLMSAASKGRYFHDHIKDRYQTRKVGW
ncbi:KTSC domain-containing protein [Kiloniella sp. b19]|uniref:KTSC domain-containing protein n=1 Tax=Kiloniella sp. GXU_MW_B19 TaxID=3141326 RepID=UPI0031E320A0